MALGSEMTPADIAAVTGNNNVGWGNDSASWIIILFLFIFMGWGGRGFGMNNAGPCNPATANDMQRGFDQQALIGGLNGIQSAVTNGFSQAEVSGCNRQANLMQQLNNMSYAQLCGMNQLQTGISDIKYTVASENCADRTALNQAMQNLMASNTANTQAILNKLEQNQMDAKNDTIARLRTQLDLANLAASQTAQTSQLMAAQAANANNIVSQLGRPAPVPAYIVPNPCTGSGTTTGGTTT